MATQSRLYETVFIVNATLDDAQIENVIERTAELITKQGGEVRNIENWGRKRLAYPIHKKNNGYYVVCEFQAPGDLFAKLERYYTLEDQIIRHLTVQLDKKALQARQQEAASAEHSAPEAAAHEPHAGDTNKSEKVIANEGDKT